VTSPHLEPARARGLRRRLLEWYRAEQRSLPWRETTDPYRIWISEAMLQQTRVETVLDYWPRFLERFPTVSALAEAREEDVLAAWSGLGYYGRACKLREAARVLVERFGGEFPRTRAEALALPGVGPYTAGAVLSIAYDLPEPLVDGNVQRVFARLFGLESVAGSARLQSELWSLAADLVPLEGGAGDWNQALMELGATICSARAPRCTRCPLQPACRAHADGRVAELPRRAERGRPTEVELCIFVVERDGRLLLERRPPGGRMAGLWQFPTIEVTVQDGAGELFPTAFAARAEEPLLEPGASRGHLRHTITRYRIRAEIRSARLLGEAPSTWRWFDRAALGRAALTGMARKVLRAENDSPLFSQ
jgi:A/G-specific adenine glycosylase